MEPTWLRDDEIRSVESAIRLAADSGRPVLAEILQVLISRHVPQLLCGNRFWLQGLQVACVNYADHQGLHRWRHPEKDIDVAWGENV